MRWRASLIPPATNKPGETKAMAIKVTVSQDAKLGDTYELEMVQYNEQRKQRVELRYK